MKKLLLFLLLFLCSLQIKAQRGYYYGTEFINLSIDKQADILLQIDNKQNENVRKTSLAKVSSLSPKILSNNRFLIAKSKIKNEDLGYTSQQYITDNGEKAYVLPNIIASLKADFDVAEILNSHSVLTLSEQIDNIVKFDCKASNSEEIWDLVSSISKMEGINWCEPDMLSEFRTCNTLYNKQYYLKNRGQTGGTRDIDINVEDAWKITNGKNVTIAIIDEGVELNHEDFGGRVMYGYTAGHASGFGFPEYPKAAHGTACAGIAAADNNNIGIRGVASKAKILPINVFPNSTGSGFAENNQVAKAIRWAYQRADVLSCSWGGGLPSNDIKTAIGDARTKGRNGKGCVVVFAAGNGGNSLNVSFPANVDGVIAVGAINKFGNIWNYSQTGLSLDLVAPSGKTNNAGDIVTTDRMGGLGYEAGNYTFNFGGTSAACPQVAGVAALMLSANYALTEEQVRTTLQQTARDLGPTGFDTTYGYGLVDAYAAVNAVSYKIEGNSFIQQKEVFRVKDLPNYFTVKWQIKGTGSYGLSYSNTTTNECTVTKHSSGPISGTLYAHLLYNNDTISTVSTEVYSKGKLSGTYEQEQCTYYNVFHPAIPKKPLDFERAVFVHQGCLVFIRSKWLEGATITFSGTPEVQRFNGKDLLLFSFPKGSGGIPITIYGKNGKYCDDFRLLFFSYSNNANAPKNSMNVVSRGRQHTVSIIDTANEETSVSRMEQRKTDAPWILEAYNLQTGNKQLTTTVINESYNLDTSSWLSGVYLIRAVVGEETFTHKINVE